jgi:hypothetical protein
MEAATKQELDFLVPDGEHLIALDAKATASYQEITHEP